MDEVAEPRSIYKYREDETLAMGRDTNERLGRWALGSDALTSVDAAPELRLFVEGLGQLDCQLFDSDDVCRILRNRLRPEWPDMLREHQTQSHLWVLGAYEVIRTVDQHVRENKANYGVGFRKQLQEAKCCFERIRIPLAKFEPAHRYKETDFRTAYPVSTFDRGVCWQVSQNVSVSRCELSECFLAVLESLAEPTSVKNAMRPT